MSGKHWVWVIATFTGVASCGGQGGGVVRPKDFTGANALGSPTEACTGEPKMAKPLIVDLDADVRGDLEASMKKGVVVIAYDCRSFRVLSDCKVEGVYEYTGVSKRETVVQLKGEDELKVNLPMSAGRLGGEVKAGRSIDLGLISIGRQSTALEKVDQERLKGTCEGATHYLQRATLGAFSLATGSVGKVAAVAELFKVGASTSSESSRSSTTQDGSLDACRAADPDGETPTKGCRSPISVELTPIKGTKPAQGEPGEAKDADAKPPPAATSKALTKDIPKEADENPCKTGYVFANGVCTRATTEAYLCDSRKQDDCKAQCEKGSFGSCYNYGRYASYSDIDPVPFFQKACDGGHAEACDELGKLVHPKNGAPQEPGAIKKAFEIYKRSCELGSGSGCMSLSNAYETEQKDLPASFRALKRSCSLGYAVGCAWAGYGYADGRGVAKDPQKGLELLDRACSSGNTKVCDTLASELQSGARFPKDLERALTLSTKMCEQWTVSTAFGAKVDAASKCEQTAEILYALGRDEPAFKYAKRACEANAPEIFNCYMMARLQEAGRGTKKDPAAARATYKKLCSNEMQQLIDSLREFPVCKKAAPKPKPKKK